MIGFAVSFIGGIAAFNFFPFFPLSIITLCIAATIFLLLIPPLVKRGLLVGRGNLWTKKFLIILIFALGFLYSSGTIRDKGFPEIKLPDKEVSLEGTIIDVPEASGEKGRFTIDKVYIEGKVSLVVCLLQRGHLFQR